MAITKLTRFLVVNEDALTIKKFATEVVKTKNLDTTASLSGDKESLLSETADLESADLFVLVDLNPDQRTRMLPALDAIIRKRINLGAKLITLRASEPRISSVAAVNLTGDEPELAKQADVVLPSLTYLEADGTIVDYLGRLKNVTKAVSSNCDAKTHREIIVDLAKAMGAEIKEAKESEVKKAAKVKIKPTLSKFARKEGLGTKSCKLMDSLNESVIKGSRLLWLKENEKAKENACA